MRGLLFGHALGGAMFRKSLSGKSILSVALAAMLAVGVALTPQTARAADPDSGQTPVGELTISLTNVSMLALNLLCMFGLVSNSAGGCDPHHRIDMSGNGLDIETDVWNAAVPLHFSERFILLPMFGTSDTEAEWASLQRTVDADTDFVGVQAFVKPAPNWIFGAGVARADTDGLIDGVEAGVPFFGHFDTEADVYFLHAAHLIQRDRVRIMPSLHYTHTDGIREEFFFNDGDRSAENEFTTDFFQASLLVGIPLGRGYDSGSCGLKDGPCAPARQPAELLLKASVFHNDTDGIVLASEVPDLDFDYTGYSLGGGISVPLTRAITVGGTVDYLERGTLDGYAAMGFVNVNFGLLAN